jgi:uncharacterized hydrophobic protein (TIGR00271 family)
VVLCDVVRESANELVEWLQDQGVHRVGAISIESPDAVLSDAAARADAVAAGSAADALVWEVLEERARNEAGLTASFVIFMALAGMIAAIGVLLDSPVLIIGAMVVGPDYGPLAAICVGVVRGRWRFVGRAAVTLSAGLAAAAVAALALTLVLRAAGAGSARYELSERTLTAFISHPDALAAVVAVLAGIAGMLSLTQHRNEALIGVVVSVTTVPALGNIGVAAAFGVWADVRGSIAQLAVNLTGLLVAGVLTLALQARLTSARTGRSPRA